MTSHSSKMALPSIISIPGKVLAFDKNSSTYLDRVISPEDTIVRAKASFERLGITRIADQTGLDRIGIPCFASFRPNAARLANNQGKGLTKAAAKASAVMEAVEFAIAESPEINTISKTAAELRSAGATIADIKSLLPIGDDLPQDIFLSWVRGYNLIDRQEIYIPMDAVDLSTNSKIVGLCKVTNGLASGNTMDEAVFHGLCELVERDARSLWTLLDATAQAKTAIDPATWQDIQVIELINKIETAGLKVHLFDQTSDIGLPTVMAMIAEVGKHSYTHFDFAAGYGTHPNSDRAAIRAITEAAQTRITSIAGSRDDIVPETYDENGLEEHLYLFSVNPTPNRAMTCGSFLGQILSDLLATAVFSIMATSYAGEIHVFPLNDPSKDGFAVVKIVAPFLEDRDANFNWRPGPRALDRMLNT